MKILNIYLLVAALGTLPLMSCSPKTETEASEKPAVVKTEPQAAKPVTYIDDRQVIDLTAEQRAALLGVMNEFLYAIGEVSGGLAIGDRQQIVDGVKDSGVDGLKMPKGTGRNFPPEFKAMSRATRENFSEIGAMAGSGATDAEILQKMSETMTLCSSCHTAYQVPTK